MNRRSVLQTTGAGSVAVTAFVGTPGATSARFDGRSPVCVDTAGGRPQAVVATDEGFECRESSESNLGNDQGFTNPDSYCDEVPDESEAIFGWLDPDDPAAYVLV